MGSCRSWLPSTARSPPGSSTTPGRPCAPGWWDSSSRCSACPSSRRSVLTITSVLVMGTLLGVVGLVVAVPILAVVIVVIRHVLQGEIYGDDTHYEPAVLRTTAEFRAPREKLSV